MSNSNEWTARLNSLREDTDNDMEAFFNLAEAMAEEMQFPLTAVWLNKSVTITAVDLTYSSHSHGLKMNALEEKTPLPIEELTFTNPDPTSADWLNFYTYFHTL